METVIVDAGPLVAYLKKDDEDHAWAVAQFQEFRTPMLTCEAALSEAAFLLDKTNGGIRQLLTLMERGLVIPAFDLHKQLPSVSRLMLQYENVPMSLADACLVRMAELHSKSSIFTLDSDFRIYRKNRKEAIPLISPA